MLQVVFEESGGWGVGRFYVYPFIFFVEEEEVALLACSFETRNLKR